MNIVSEASSGNLATTDTPVWWQVVRGQVSSLRYGVVQIVIHDSRVVQVERTEKFRFDKEDKTTL